MSPAAETRLNILFNNILKAFEGKKTSGTHHVHVQHSLADKLKPFYALVVKLMYFTCLAATI